MTSQEVHNHLEKISGMAFSQSHSNTRKSIAGYVVVLISPKQKERGNKNTFADLLVLSNVRCRAPPSLHPSFIGRCTPNPGQYWTE